MPPIHGQAGEFVSEQEREEKVTRSLLGKGQRGQCFHVVFDFLTSLEVTGIFFFRVIFVLSSV